MFCPLCKAEYREGFAACSTCGTALVADDADESQRNPRQLRWATQDRTAFDRAGAQLRDAGIPFREHSEADHWLFAVGGHRASFAIFVLERDADAASKTAGIEFRELPPPKPEDLPQQTCPVCQTEFPADVGLCPGCGTDLLEWKPQEEPPAGDESEGEPPPSDAGEDDALELVWRGGDPVTYSRALLALREAQITHVPAQNFDHMAFGMAMPRPRLEIRVRRSDSDRAHELMREFQDPFPLVPQDPTSSEAEEKARAAESGGDAEPADVAAPVTAEVEYSAEYAKRKSQLRWGSGLLFVSILLGYWVVRPVLPPNLLHPGIGEIRFVAGILLLLTSGTIGVAAYWSLYRSWGWRADKIGFLSWFFAWYGLMWYYFLAFAVSL